MKQDATEVKNCLTSTFLVGEKIEIQSLVSEDFAERMIRWVNNREVTKYLVRGTFPGNLEEFQQEYKGLVNNRSDVQFAIVSRSDSQRIGVVGLHRIEWIARHAEFRVLIGEPSYWGKGLGTEAAHLMLAYGFEILNLQKVYLGVNAANLGAFRSYIKAGFKEEGVLRREVFRNGQYFDVNRMSMLREEYEACRGQWPIFNSIKKQLQVGGQ